MNSPGQTGDSAGCIGDRNLVTINMGNPSEGRKRIVYHICRLPGLIKSSNEERHLRHLASHQRLRLGISGSTELANFIPCQWELT